MDLNLSRIKKWPHKKLIELNFNVPYKIFSKTITNTNIRKTVPLELERCIVFPLKTFVEKYNITFFKYQQNSLGCLSKNTKKPNLPYSVVGLICMYI